MSSSETRNALIARLPDGIKLDAEPVFTEPWQAQAFAMAVALLEQKVFSLTEWASALGEEIAGAKGAGLADDGSDYYQLWLAALERLATRKQLTAGEELSQLKAAWRDAYASTPHGEPVSLDPEMLQIPGGDETRPA